MIKAAPATSHNHAHCIASALTQADALCEQRDARLTKNRRRVLELVWQSHAPVGAYELLERLREDAPRAAPPTVYRALEFLMSHGLVHRIETRNAFVGCPKPQHEHEAQYLLCEACGDAVEIDVGGVRRRITTLAAQHGFTVAAQTIEVRGLCRRCQPAAS